MAGGINLGVAYLTVEPSTRGMAPAIAAAWKAAEGAARAAGDAAGAQYSKAAEGAVRKAKPDAFDGTSAAAGVEGSKAGKAFADRVKEKVSASKPTLNVFKDGTAAANIDGIRAGSAYSTSTQKAMGGLKGRVKGIVNDALNNQESARKHGEAVGNSYKTSLIGSLGKFAGPLGIVAATAGSAVGAALTAGLDRYTSIENAQAKLEALGNSSGDIDKIMSGATAAVKGTAFGLGDATSVAASAVASGIKPGEQLNQVLRTVANTAAVAGVDMQSMGAIFNKVAASGKLQGDDLAQLADNGVPAVQLLAKELGVSAETVYDMASKGQIDFATFQRAMSNGMSADAAKKMGDTLTGTFSNMKAAVGRFGAEIWKSIGPAVKDALTALTNIFDQLAPKVTQLFQFLSNNKDLIGGIAVTIGAMTAAWGTYILITTGIPALIGGVKTAMMALNTTMRANPVGVIITLIAGLVAAFIWAYQHSETFRNIINGALNGIKTVALAVAGWFSGPFLDFFKAIGAWFAGPFAGFFTTVWNGIVAGFQAVAGFFSAIWDGIRIAVAVVLGIIITLFQLWWAGVMAVLNPIKDFFILLFTGIWTLLKPVIDIIWQGILIAFNFVWSGIVNTFNMVKDFFIFIWNAIWGFIKPIIDVIWQGILFAFDWMKNGVINTFNMVKDFFIFIWNAIWGVISPIIDTIKNGISTAFNWMKNNVIDTITGLKNTLSTLWDGIKAVFRDPINAVIRFINDPFISNINMVLDKFGMQDKHIPNIPTIPMANGGVLNREPQVRNRPILWAEAGPEAYIPLDPAKRQRSLALWQQVGRQLGATALADGAVFPLPAGTYTQTQGLHGVDGGYDFAVPVGTPVMANSTGTVVTATDLGNRSYGKYVKLSNGSIYAHLSGLNVSPGQAVNAGDVIGYSGNTGHSTGPHLHYVPAGSLGSAISTWFQSALSLIESTWSGITGPFNTMKNSLGNTVVGDMLRGITGSLWDGGKSWLTRIRPAWGSDNGAVPGGVERWRGTVLEALARVGQPASFADAVLRQMADESGGNPRAINLWDINARNGNPSKGLMQVIQTTFNAFRDRSLSGDIYDPLANVVAALRYTMTRYGSLSIFDKVKGYDNGGWLNPGFTMSYNATRKPEAILTSEQWRSVSAIAANGGNGSVHIDNLTVQVDADDLLKVKDVVELFDTLGLEAARV